MQTIVDYNRLWVAKISFSQVESSFRELWASYNLSYDHFVMSLLFPCPLAQLHFILLKKLEGAIDEYCCLAGSRPTHTQTHTPLFSNSLYTGSTMDLILLLIWPGFRICVHYAQCYTVSYAKKLFEDSVLRLMFIHHKRKGDYFWNLMPTNIWTCIRIWSNFEFSSPSSGTFVRDSNWNQPLVCIWA